MFAILVSYLAFFWAFSRAETPMGPISFDKLEQWVSAELPNDGMGAFSPHIELVRDRWGSALRAKGVVKAGEIMVRAPFTRCFSLYTAFRSQIGSVLYALYTHHEVEEMFILRLFVMHEMLLQSESDFWPTIENWPEQPGASLYFNPQELEGLQNSETAQEGRDGMRSCFESYRDTFVEGTQLFTMFPSVFEPELYTPTLWTKASVLLWSRYFNTEVTMKLPTGMETPDEPLPARPYHTGEEVDNNMVMIPALSMINHDALYPYCNEYEGESTFEFDEETNVYQLRNIMEIPAGEPVYWCYNELDNAQLIGDYGFALSLDLNPYEEVIIYLKDSTFYYDPTETVLKDPDAASIVIQARSLLDEKGIDVELVKKLCRFIEETEKTCKDDPEACNNDDDADDDEYDFSSAALAARMLRDLLQRLPTTLAVDEALLLDQGAVDALGAHGFAVLTYRIAQKTLLTRTAAALEAFKTPHERRRNRNDYDVD